MIKFNESGGAITFTVRVAAPPVEGAANEELIRTLARAFGVAARSVEITRGRGSKTKQVRVGGATAARLAELSKS